jgi:PilZ domain-containing protein
MSFNLERFPLPNHFKHTVAALAHTLLAPEQDADRRSEARYPTQDPAELEILPGPTQTLYGTILDVSRSGLKISLPQRIDRGRQVKVKLHGNVIFGEVRYCRAVSGSFQIGIRIQDLVPAEGQNQHISDDPLSLYAVGKGLSVPEVIDIRRHLILCEACRVRLAKREAALNPSRNARPRRPLV